MKDYLSDKEFNGLDFVDEKHRADEFENCLFTNCSFSKADLSNIKFIDCSFYNCNFSGAILLNTAFQEASFKDCKMLGLRFDDCNQFLLAFRFQNCQLDYSSFYKLSIPKTVFTSCQLQEVDFVETDLSESTFAECNLVGAIFEGTKLLKTDLTTSWNFSINPDLNLIKKARFSKQNIIGLLGKYDIHIE